MENVFSNIGEICLNLLPLLGVIILITLIIFIISLIKASNKANSALTKSLKTIDLVDETIVKIQSPLDTVVKVSKTIDKAHDATLKGIEDAKEYVNKNAKIIKEKISNLKNDFLYKEKNNELKEPSDDEIIGGF